MIYLLDNEGQQIGPFENRNEVERFIEMMALCGESWADHKIVEGNGEDAPGKNPALTGFCAKPSKGAYRLKLVGRRP